MYRRTFLKGTLGLAATLTLPASSRAQTMSSTAVQTHLETLQVTLTDTGFELPDFIPAGRYEFAATNAGTMTESHFGIGRFPDEVTEDDIVAFFAAQGEDTDVFGFDDIEFVGAADWPQPGQPPVTGVIDLQPGRYMAFKPLSDEVPLRFSVEGRIVEAVEPASDVTIDLHEMQITLPDAAITSAPLRWKIQNTGSMSHEVAVVPVSADFTDEHLQMLFEMDENATPPPGVPDLVYQPTAAIGILAGGHTSWLDVQLEPGRYLAACMLPFGTGYPHAMDGMYRFIDVA